MPPPGICDDLEFPVYPDWCPECPEGVCSENPGPDICDPENIHCPEYPNWCEECVGDCPIVPPPGICDDLEFPVYPDWCPECTDDICPENPGPDICDPENIHCPEYPNWCEECVGDCPIVPPPGICDDLEFPVYPDWCPECPEGGCPENPGPDICDPDNLICPEYPNWCEECIGECPIVPPPGICDDLEFPVYPDWCPICPPGENCPDVPEDCPSLGGLFFALLFCPNKHFKYLLHARLYLPIQKLLFFIKIFDHLNEIFSIF